MNKKILKHLTTISLSIILTLATILITNNDIFAILPQDSAVGNINISLKLYTPDYEEIHVNEGDIKIYQTKELTRNETTGEYIINESTKEAEYISYGNKIVLPSNIYSNENVNKLFSTKNTSYNININDINTYSLALTSPNFIFSLEDYKNNISLTESIAQKDLLTNYSIIKDKDISISLDEFYIVINNDELKNSILEFKFEQKEQFSSITYRFNQIINITYSLDSENTTLAILNTAESTPTPTPISEALYTLSNTEDVKKEVQMVKNFSNTGVFSLPVTQYITKLNTVDNKTIYSLNNGTVIKSVTDEGVVEKINANTLKVKYTENFYVLYENIISSVYNNALVDSGDIIGIVKPNSELIISYIYNDKALLCDWMFDIYPEPLDGPAMSLMLQGDPIWKDSPYGVSTIGKAGCGPSSYSMILSYYKNEVWTPARLVEHMKEMGGGSHSWCHAPGQGSYHSIFATLSEEFGLNCEDIGISEKTFKKNLEEGKFIIICISHGPIYGGDGHFIVLRGLTEDGYFLINDPAGLFKLNGKYTYRDLGSISAAKTIFN